MAISAGVNWLRVWRLKLPAKIRNFIWRILSNCLPTMTTLRRRRVDVLEWCPICRQEPEIDLHALVLCPTIRGVWSLTSLGSYMGSTNSFIDWWNNLVSSNDSTDIKIAAAVLWSIWLNRNDVVWNGKHKPQMRELNSVPKHNYDTYWRKPPPHFLKCNVDAAIFNDPPRMGFGCLVRDEHGSVVAASHGCIFGISDPTLAKALSIREALSWLKELNLSNLIVESDALLVIQALKNKASDISSLDLIVEDCKSLVSDLHSCSFVFVRRSANQAVHLLARAVGSMKNNAFSDKLALLF
ncbi:uncharacterized protein [Henckelia pumila]|uniref:uncharacterized protein n=1 Tax=Henckelia pumila TaxID=405737 RepID=UPI003C6E2AF3